MSVASWRDDLFDFLLPAGCVACGSWIRRGATLVCAECRTRLREAPWPRCPRCHHPRGTGRAESSDCLECRTWPAALAAARFAYELDPPATDLVHALKYEGWRELAAEMAPALARVANGCIAAGAPVVVVPVPTTAARLAERGYNQAGLLAERVAARLELPEVGALERLASPRSQTALSPTERRENVHGAFVPAAAALGAIRGAAVLLVDDVLTTGATAGEAATVLASMGAHSVTVLAYARALPRRPRRAA